MERHNVLFFDWIVNAWPLRANSHRPDLRRICTLHSPDNMDADIPPSANVPDSTETGTSSKKTKKPCGPQRWTTQEEYDFLVALVPLFLSYKGKKNFEPFWSKMTHDWFQKFPERDRMYPTEPGMPMRDLNDAEVTALGVAVKKRKAVSG